SINTSCLRRCMLPPRLVLPVPCFVPSRPEPVGKQRPPLIVGFLLRFRRGTHQVRRLRVEHHARPAERTEMNAAGFAFVRLGAGSAARTIEEELHAVSSLNIDFSNFTNSGCLVFMCAAMLANDRLQHGHTPLLTRSAILRRAMRALLASSLSRLVSLCSSLMRSSRSASCWR